MKAPNDLPLSGYEYVCDKCQGLGYTIKTKIPGCKINISGNMIKIPGVPQHETCSKCNGSKKLDWIENIIGKKPPTEIDISKSAMATASEEMAKEVDRKIMNVYTSTCSNKKEQTDIKVFSIDTMLKAVKKLKRRIGF